MPNKYEREIEEILRNLERTEPKPRFGQRVSERIQRKARARRNISLPTLGFAEWGLLLLLIAALAGGGWAYAAGANLVTGILALVGAVCVLLVAISNFLRYPSPSTRYTNVTPIRRNPLRRLMTSWHLLMLKLRYRKQGKRES